MFPGTSNSLNTTEFPFKTMLSFDYVLHFFMDCFFNILEVLTNAITLRLVPLFSLYPSGWKDHVNIMRRSLSRLLESNPGPLWSKQVSPLPFGLVRPNRAKARALRNVCQTTDHQSKRVYFCTTRTRLIASSLSVENKQRIADSRKHWNQVRNEKPNG